METILNAGVVTASILLTLAVGLEVDRTAIREALRLRVRLLVFWILQFVVPPIVALVLAQMFNLPLHILAGLLLLAACPVGDIANAYTLLARGPIACSLAVNALSCLVAPLTMALTFAVYEALLGDAFAFAIPTPVLVLRVLVLAVLPVLFGASWRALYPGSANRFRPWIRHVCVGCIGVLIVYVLSNQWEHVLADAVTSMVTAGAFLGITLTIGWWVARGMNLTGPERACGAFLIGVRNLGMMAAVAIAMLDRTDYAVFGAIYFVVQVVVALALVGWTLRRAN
ncbi:MAG TPA: hypothetical protein PKE55_09690 [Kiritimatiellia bacterium]|nr:hypothetical protein [Kiritimatiellia bacterium]